MATINPWRSDISWFLFGWVIIHIYMAAIAAGMRPAIVSMFTGTISEDYAKEHHKMWYNELDDEYKG